MTDAEMANLFQIQSANKQEESMITVSLGLHLCRELIELLNGQIAVKSEKEVGTTFSIQLPRGN